MRTKEFILLGAGYAAGRMSKKIQAGPIGAVKKAPIIKRTAIDILDEYRYMHLDLGFSESTVIEGILKKYRGLDKDYLKKLISVNKDWLKKYASRTIVPKDVINKNLKIPRK